MPPRQSAGQPSMEDSEIPLTIQRIIARQLKHEPERITAASHLRNDLGADSLDALEILFQLEEEFDIKIPEADARRMAKVQDIVGYVTRRIKSPNKDVE